MFFFFFQAEDGIRDLVRSRGLGMCIRDSPSLSPLKRRGNRRYYQRQDVIMIRQIRSLLYQQGFTIDGARQKLAGGEAKEDATQVRQVIDQTVSELESLLQDLKS